ncbi:double-strand break repair helicase AddA [Methylocella silvestris BL2]|uniref:DNA 3'-5' helicase n=1 Tax=Methylocella silvestris (strain DSM 15510 / CIP 108128 / LMG 27833 / NCIMB 13906 / BL2) TaxID=395965 RepID=B8ESP2_METSB|nr:double-strand break repair helicase AddA [Methylocella silvestris]ACK50377.1 double-strand break repair helicase AddA [Methylocella silvestris BL2]
MDLAAISPQTLQKQREASDPAASVWVSANAGSGKTHVLAQRVVRLLLQGTPPSKILCLTFTKAAAANMSMRVFNTLARWTALDDAELRRAIVATGAPSPDWREMREARKLFARTVETPGGLKIQTIHAFCERLLHLFPFEANAPSRFEVADEERQGELLARARNDVLGSAAEADHELKAIVDRVAGECSEYGFATLLEQALRLRARLREAWPKDHESVLRKALDVAPGRDVAAIRQDMLEGGIAPSRWSELAAFLETGTKTDCDRAAAFRDAAARHAAGDSEGCRDVYLQIFFTDKGEKAKRLLTRGLAAKNLAIEAALYAEQERLDRLRAEEKSAATLERSAALGRLVDAIFARYQKLKYERVILDFDDLVAKTLTLLERSDASWVLYKLDAGIDHILIDEAQDTSEAQWRILEGLMADFAVGHGRNLAPRTFFAVGDEKQSIFSFQGAAPHMFHEMQRKFERKFINGGERFSHVRLTHSFRSAAGVLGAVDSVFGRAESQSGLVAPADVWMGHEPLKTLPSLVEIWPSVGAGGKAENSDWRLPLDFRDESDPPSRVATRIAEKIAALIEPRSGERVHDGESGVLRAVRAGDILILVRTRGPFFEAVIRALKQKGVPVAGADRLKLGEHIAVQDLVAAGRAALLPEDDLNLAAALKSPLIGLDDDDLIALAPGRPGSLFAALLASPDSRFRPARETLGRWRARAAARPFAFYASLLGEDQGRRAIEGRLGVEAVDAVDEFLRLALAHEAEPAPSLAGFLADFETVQREVRRDMESGGDVVRVMTVHAAKGLEAKIVFLPDTCGGLSAQHDPSVFALEETHLGAAPVVWSPRKAEDCDKAAAARKRLRELAEDEYRRLLYVALTRAEERIYICGFHGAKKPPELCWANMIEATLAPTLQQAPAFWNVEEFVLRRLSPGADLAVQETAAPVEGGSLIAPGWLSRRLDPLEEPAAPMRPSSALAASDRRADAAGRREALQLGSLTHILLQYLPDQPVEARARAGLAYLAVRAKGLDEAAHERLLQAALAVIAAPQLEPLFGAGSRAEVAVAGKIALPGGASVDVIGRIDRLGLSEGEVWVADFKTGAPPAPGEVPQSYLTQMALYRAALRPLWPERRLRMILIFTEGPQIIELAEAALDAALAAVAAAKRPAP